MLEALNEAHAQTNKTIIKQLEAENEEAFDVKNIALCSVFKC